MENYEEDNHIAWEYLAFKHPLWYTIYKGVNDYANYGGEKSTG